jgi:hypothetical protein
VEKHGTDRYGAYYNKYGACVKNMETRSEYVENIAFTLQQMLYNGTTMLRLHVPCLSVLAFVLANCAADLS